MKLTEEQMAINRLLTGNTAHSCKADYIKLAINALEKQVPMKPRFYAHNYHCTECGNLVGNNEFEWQRFLYCDNCGQKLDWSEYK